MSHHTGQEGFNGGTKKIVLTVIAAGVLSWGGWVSMNTASYVSGASRGERLSTVEAELMIQKAIDQLRREHLELEKKLTRLEAEIARERK